MDFFPYLLLAAPFFGLLFGSFFNVCIDRGAEGRSIVRPGSACESCGTRLRPHELVPVLSWLLLRGRCAHCGATVSVRYPVSELLAAILFTLVVRTYGANPETLVYLVFTSIFFVASGIDLKTGLLFDRLTLPSAALALPAALWLGHDPIDTVVGGLAGWGLFRLVTWLFERSTGREGLGLGDSKLMLSIGFLTGGMHLPMVVLLASLGALAVFVALRSTGRDASELRLPFGPFLSGAAFVTWLAGDALWAAWLDLIL